MSVVDGTYEKDDENDDDGGDRRRRTTPEESFAVEGVDVDDAWTAASPSIVMCILGVIGITWNVLIPTLRRGSTFLLSAEEKFAL